jgi:hypothetical protein
MNDESEKLEGTGTGAEEKGLGWPGWENQKPQSIVKLMEEGEEVKKRENIIS